MTDKAYSALLQWVRGGGIVFLTGDLCRDEHRRPVKAARLRELAGLERIAECYPPNDRSQGASVTVDLGPIGMGRQPLRPCLTVRPLGGDVLGRQPDGSPVLVRTRVGKGLVYFLSDPIEQSDQETDRLLRQRLYQSILADAGRQTGNPIAPFLDRAARSADQHFPSAHRARFGLRCRQQPPAGRDDRRYPSARRNLGHVTDRGWLAGLATCAPTTAEFWPLAPREKCALVAETLTTGRGLHALSALDRADLRRSSAIVLAPYEPGECVLTGRGDRGVSLSAISAMAPGNVRAIAIADGPAAVSLDADRATCLVLFCRPGREAFWTAAMEQALTHPDLLPAE